MHQCIKFILFWDGTLHVSDGLSITHQQFKSVHTATKQILLSACQQAHSSICLTNACCCMYSLELLMMEEKTVRNMQSVIPNKINLIHCCNQLVLLQKQYYDARPYGVNIQFPITLFQQVYHILLVDYPPTTCRTLMSPFSPKANMYRALLTRLRRTWMTSGLNFSSTICLTIIGSSRFAQPQTGCPSMHLTTTASFRVKQSLWLNSVVNPYPANMENRVSS